MQTSRKSGSPVCSRILSTEVTKNFLNPFTSDIGHIALLAFWYHFGLIDFSKFKIFSPSSCCIQRLPAIHSALARLPGSASRSMAFRGTKSVAVNPFESGWDLHCPIPSVFVWFRAKAMFIILHDRSPRNPSVPWLPCILSFQASFPLCNHPDFTNLSEFHRFHTFPKSLVLQYQDTPQGNIFLVLHWSCHPAVSLTDVQFSTCRGARWASHNPWPAKAKYCSMEANKRER